MQKKTGIFRPPFEFTEIPAFTNCVHSILPQNDPELQFCFLARTHISLTFFFFLSVCFKTLHSASPSVLPLPPLPAAGRVSADMGGSPVRCGSALFRTQWQQAGGRPRAVQSGPRTKQSAGWGPRRRDWRRSVPGRTLRRSTEGREREEEKKSSMARSPDAA